MYMDIHSKIKTKIDNISEMYYDLGELFYTVYESSAYEELGYVGPSGFETYCTKELGYSFQSARQRMVIFKTYEELGITREELAEITFSNALALVSYINVDNKEYWLEQAKKLTHKELRAEIDRLFGNITKQKQEDMDIGVQDKSYNKFTFKYDSDRADFMQLTLSKADEQYECGGNHNEALYRMAQDYATVFHNKTLTLDTILSILNEKFNTSVTPQQVLATKRGATINA